MELLKFLKSKDTFIGYLYFYIHFITEVACFYYLYNMHGDNAYLWTLFLMYDALAFVPQSLIGRFKDKHPNINLGILGNILLFIAILLLGLNLQLKYLGLIILCIGNCFIHVSGGVDTLTTSKGKLFPSAIFVAGGSFGVITGRLLGINSVSYIYILILLITMIPFLILANNLKEEVLKTKIDSSKYFKYNKKGISLAKVLYLSVLVVIIRGYMGYGIPMSWNKSINDTILLFCLMGIGKGLGGLLADIFGVKKIALLSVTLALPFLLLGNNYMIVSLIGVLFFSMTMSISLAVIYSVLSSSPGLSFGLTTIGLFLGTLPVFFYKITNIYIMWIVMIVLTIICLIILNHIIENDGGKT